MDLDLICPDHTTLSRRSQTLKELQEQLKKVQKKESIHILSDSTGHWCTNRRFDKNIAGLLFFHHFYLKICLSWHLAQQGKVQVVIK